MKIIVCGGGSVGKSIVSYLVKGNNDITVIDNNQRNLDDISQEYDVLPILGEASHPDILEKADAEHTDLILAVTDCDEVNMVICQIAQSIYEIPHKIARIDSEEFLDPLWGFLYNEKHIPIDLIISPNIEIANAVISILKYPGCSGALPVFNGKSCILSLKLHENCPLLNIPLMQLARIDNDLDISFVNVSRGTECFIPEVYGTLDKGDEINILVKKEDIENVIRSFKLEKPANERVVIFGGNHISLFLGQKFENDDSIVSCKIVEENIDAARKLALELHHAVVIQGPMMSDIILKEAGISHTDASIAVTSNDKDNLLASMLASQSGVSSTVAVVNTPSYNNLIANIGDNILIDRSSVIISKILKEIRKTKIHKAYSLNRGQGEMWEIVLDEENPAVGKKIGELGLPKLSRVFAIERQEKIIYPDPTTTLENGDRLLLYMDSGVIKQVEKIIK